MSLAYRGDGGRVIVVLSKREKLEMEAMFRRTIPEDARYGSTFVFRQARLKSGQPHVDAECCRCIKSSKLFLGSEQVVVPGNVPDVCQRSLFRGFRNDTQWVTRMI